jgi:hypothetical protein
MINWKGTKLEGQLKDKLEPKLGGDNGEQKRV